MPLREPGAPATPCSGAVWGALRSPAAPSRAPALDKQADHSLGGHLIISEVGWGPDTSSPLATSAPSLPSGLWVTLRHLGNGKDGEVCGILEAARAWEPSSGTSRSVLWGSSSSELSASQVWHFSPGGTSRHPDTFIVTSAGGECHWLPGHRRA